MSKNKVPANWQNEWIPLWDAVLQIGKHTFKDQWDEECLELHKHYIDDFKDLIDSGHFVDDKISFLTCIPHEQRFGYFLATQEIPELYLQYEDNNALTGLPESKAKKIALREFRKLAMPSLKKASDEAIEGFIVNILNEDHHIMVLSQVNTEKFKKLYRTVAGAIYDRKLISAGINKNGHNEIISPEAWLNSKGQAQFFQETLSVNDAQWQKIKIEPDSLAKFTGRKNKVGARPSSNKEQWLNLLKKLANQTPSLNDEQLTEAIHDELGTLGRYIELKERASNERCTPAKSSVTKERTRLIQKGEILPRE